MPCHNLLSCPCLQSPNGFTALSRRQSWHYCITYSVVMRSVGITANVGFYTPPKLQNFMMHVLLSLMDACSRFSTHVNYFYANRMFSNVFAPPYAHLLQFLYDVFDYLKKK